MNKEAFKALVSDQKSGLVDTVRERVRNREMLRESGRIALLILAKLDELGMTQAKLAEALGVSPQQVSKIVKGRENLTLETIVKIQRILRIPILKSFESESEMYREAKVITLQTQMLGDGEYCDGTGQFQLVAGV